MNISVKQLKGGECHLEVLPTTKISEIKQHIAARLKIPMEEQTLLLLGRTLGDDYTIDAYPSIKEGSKLNLVVKKTEGLFETSMKHFKKSGMTEVNVRNATNEMLKAIEEKINKLSWDDIERLTLDCLMDEYGVPMSGSDQDTENESDDGIGL